MRLAENDQRVEAIKFIMQMHGNRHDFFSRQGHGFEASELDQAVMDVSNERAIDILISDLTSGAHFHLSVPIIEFLADVGSDDEVTALLNVAEGSDH